MTCKSLYTFITIMFFTITANCQDKKQSKFDKVYINSFREEKVDRVLKIGDSLYKNSETELQKIKSFVVIASAYSRQLNTSKSIRYWKKVDSMGKREELADWITLANERLAAEYLKLDLMDASKQFLGRATSASKHLSGSVESQYIYAMMLETEALQKIKEKDTLGFIKSIKINQDYLKTISKSNVRDYLLGRSSLKLGEVYVQRKQLDSADYFFRIAEKNMKNTAISVPSYEGAALYRGLGNLALKRKNFDQAEQYLLKAKDIALNNGNQEVRDIIIQDLRKYYRTVRNYKKLYEINQIMDSLNLVKKNQLVSVADQDFKDEFASKSKFRNYMYILLVVSSLLTLIIAGVFIYYKQQKKKSKLQFEKIIEKLKAEEKADNSETVLSPPIRNISPENTDDENDSSLHISTEKEEELVERMKNFEKKHLYLDKDISRPKMASLLNTNTKYLSYIIKKYHGSDFSDYINSNRINYIVKQLYNDPKYRNYKISYLAESCGYSSHSRFANIFKKQMNISPSEFINQLQKSGEKADESHSAI